MALGSRRTPAPTPTGRYIALLDGEAGRHGVSFPQLPGCVAMGRTLDGAMLVAADALREFVQDLEAAGARLPPPEPAETLVQDRAVAEALRAGARLASIPLVRATGRSVKANLSINAGLLAAIDEDAARQGISRSAWIETMARDALASCA